MASLNISDLSEGQVQVKHRELLVSAELQMLRDHLGVKQENLIIGNKWRYK